MTDKTQFSNLQFLNIGGYQDKDKLKSSLEWSIVDINENADIIVDIAEEILPFNSESIDAVYCSHLLEHIDLHRLTFVFSEMYRVLRKEGIIRIVVPDWDIAIRAYNENNYNFLKETRVVADNSVYPDIPILNLFSWAYSYHFNGKERINVHKTPFNKDVLFYFLNNIGFKNIEFKEYNKCSLIFAGLDLEQHKQCSLYCEAIKC